MLKEKNKINVEGENYPHSPSDVLNTPLMGSGKIIIVVEIGRPIIDEVKAQLGEPVEVVSYKRPILEEEIPQIAGQVYKAIKKHSGGGNVIHLVLSGMLGLAFSVGQLVGLSHFKIQLWQYSGGRYKPVPPVSREVMF